MGVDWGDGHDPRPAVPDRGVEDAVEASPFADRPRFWLSVDPSFPILEIDVTGQDVLQSFSRVAEHVPDGWDLVAALRWGREDPEVVQWQLRRREEFERSHRAGFGPEPATFGPDDLVEAASRWTEADVQRRFDVLEVERDGIRDGTKGEVLDVHLGATARALGSAPDPSDVPASIGTEADLDRWLLGWELDHGSPPRDQVQEWFDPTGLPLVIRVFPRRAPFAAVAIEHWWDSDLPFVLAALQRWHRRYGARLIAHFGTMLEILAAECPRDVEQAWALAREQDLLCDALLNPLGDVRRHLALGLMVERKWFLHSRP